MNTKMKIEEHKIAVREVFDGYVDSAELGVRGYGGKLGDVGTRTSNLP